MMLNMENGISYTVEMNLEYALSEISKLADALNLPRNIVDTASLIYRKAVKEHLMRGRSIRGVTAAAVYMSCRQCGLARTLEEIADASNINKKEIGRNYRFLVKELNYLIPPMKCGNYISRLSELLNLDTCVCEVAHKIISMAEKLRLTFGRSPTVTAASSIYIASILTGERKSRKEIAEAAKVSGVIIRYRYKELNKKLLYEITL